MKKKQREKEDKVISTMFGKAETLKYKYDTKRETHTKGHKKKKRPGAAEEI